MLGHARRAEAARGGDGVPRRPDAAGLCVAHLGARGDLAALLRGASPRRRGLKALVPGSALFLAYDADLACKDPPPAAAGDN